MGAIDSVADLTEYGHTRLSEHVFMREMLYSEVSNFHGMQNIPEDPDLALHVGEQIATKLIEPLRTALGHVTIRSACRSPTVIQFCHNRHKELTAQGITDGAYDCSDKVYSASHHLWDRRDEKGHCGGTVSLVIPWFLPHDAETNDPRPLAWWIRDNLPGYAEVIFLPWLAAFNIRRYEGEPTKTIDIDDGVSLEEEVLTRPDMENFAGDHSAHYRASRGMNVVTIRSAAMADADRIAELARELGRWIMDADGTTTAETIHRHAFGPDRWCDIPVAKHRGRILGYALYRVFHEGFTGRRRFFPSDLGVAAEERRAGTQRQHHGIMIIMAS